MKIGYPLSFSIIFWSIVGFIRFITEDFWQKKKHISSKELAREKRKVAVCLPAHNEEEVIESSIKSIKRQIPISHIYVASDGSTDRTGAIARNFGCHVVVNKQGKGKAKALKGLISKFRLLEKYDYILFVDADTMLDKNYFRRALLYMKYHPEVAVLAAHAKPFWKKKFIPGDAEFISSYRTRLYKILQLTLMYGQTWKYTNVNAVVPGFASLYRTNILKKLEIDTPGIWIEDFNLAFQIHKRKLGKIGYHPSIFAIYHDPHTLDDYWNQVRRWNVGFLQTIRVHKIWPSLFWLSLLVFNFELISIIVFILLVPLAAIYIVLLYLEFETQGNFISTLLPDIHIYFIQTLLGLIIIDYLITIIVAVRERKYRLMLYGPFFIFFQLVNSIIFVSALKQGFFARSVAGKWEHAKRK